MAPVPFSPVHNARKFSAVLGTISANNSKTILPTEEKEKEITSLCKWVNKKRIISISNQGATNGWIGWSLNSLLTTCY